MEAVAGKGYHDCAGVDGGVIFDCLHFLREMLFVVGHSEMFPLDLLYPQQQLFPLTLILIMRGQYMLFEM